jgi:hypothetical protein
MTIHLDFSNVLLVNEMKEFARMLSRASKNDGHVLINISPDALEDMSCCASAFYHVIEEARDKANDTNK